MVKGLVSVIVPVFNRQEYIAETIKSILEQTYKNLGIIIINDGSTDNTKIIVEEFQKRHSDRIILLNQRNQGQVSARNNGLKIAKGEFIAFLDSDDLWLPGKLEKQLCLFNKNVGLVYSGVQYIDARGVSIGEEKCDQKIRHNIYNELLVKNRMTGGTVVIKAETLESVGLFDEKLKAAENWDLWLRIAKQYEVDFVDEALLKYRKHNDNMSKNNTLMLDATYQILEKHCSHVASDSASSLACKVATANYYYRKGIYLIAINDYVNARINFKRSKKIVPNYLDCNIRIMRSYMGHKLNRLVSKFATAIKRII